MNPVTARSVLRILMRARICHKNPVLKAAVRAAIHQTIAAIRGDNGRTAC